MQVAMAHVRVTGSLVPDPGDRYAVVVSRFNRQITEALEAGAVDAFQRHGVPAERIDVVTVPGALELAFATRRLITRPYRAIVCLGAVVRGETPHFDYVAQNTAARLSELGAGDVPVVFGVLTCDTMEQARDRAGGKAGNKGAEAAEVALELSNLARLLDQSAEATHA